MKKLLSSLILVAVLSFVACNSDKKNDNAEVKEGTEKIESPMAPASITAAAAVAHACAADCKEGNHSFAHNEVGHNCSEVCGSTHACAAKCADGKHMFAHGEAGHTCTDECSKM